jgi:hypothetical protein
MLLYYIVIFITHFLYYFIFFFVGLKTKVILYVKMNNNNTDIDKLMNELELMKQENTRLQEENAQLRERLGKYTRSERKKRYYEKHREEILEKAKEKHKIIELKPIDKKDEENANELDKILKEKRKEYNKKAYLKKKNEQKNKQ